MSSTWGKFFLKPASPNLLDLCLLISSAAETELPTPCSPLRADNFWSGLQWPRHSYTNRVSSMVVNVAFSRLSGHQFHTSCTGGDVKMKICEFKGTDERGTESPTLTPTTVHSNPFSMWSTMSLLSCLRRICGQYTTLSEVSWSSSFCLPPLWGR